MPKVPARRGREFGWKWDSILYGKVGPGELWLSFQFPKFPPPRAGGSAAPRANAGQLASLRKRARAPNCQNCGESGGDANPSSLFPTAGSPAYPLGIRDALLPTWVLLAPSVESFCSRAGRTAALVGGGWASGVPESSLSHFSPPTNPSQSCFLALSRGWLDRRGLAPDLWGAPQVFNDSLKVAVGKV